MKGGGFMTKLSLRGARVNAGLKVKNVAQKLGVTTQTIYNWEQGITEPRINYLKMLSELYNIEINKFK